MRHERSGRQRGRSTKDNPLTAARALNL